MRATERGLDIAIVTSSGPEWVCEQPSGCFSHSHGGTKSFRCVGALPVGTVNATSVQAHPPVLVPARRHCHLGARVLVSQWGLLGPSARNDAATPVGSSGWLEMTLVSAQVISGFCRSVFSNPSQLNRRETGIVRGRRL
jgi:hypothetical protein